MLNSTNSLYPNSAISSANAADKSAESSTHRKLTKAAQEFEGMLISQLMGGFQSGLASVGGSVGMAGAEGLNSLATQALSTALAKGGGLGIANMVMRQLEPRIGK